MYIICKGLIVIIPVEKNHKYIAEIDALSSEGSGIAHIDGYTLFIPQTVPGDTVRVLVVKTKTSYGYARVEEIIKPSEKRITPPCPHFSKCGGCQLMALGYGEQLEFKRKTVEDALMRIGGADVSADIIGMDEPTRYRNKMVFPFGSDGRWGFYRSHSHDVVPLDDCLLGSELNGKIMAAVTEYMARYNVSAYDEASHSGLIRRVFVREGEREFMVVISVNGTDLPHTDELVDGIRRVSERIKGIILNVNTKRTNLVLGEKNITLWGKDRISAKLCGLDYEVSPHSFFQVNPIQTEKMYETAVKFADIGGDDTVLDIYCGIGTISLTCAKKAKKVIGVEIVPEAVADARDNAFRNGVDNAEFFLSAAEDIVPEMIERGEAPDVVILDPPRKGSDEKTLSAVMSAAPKRIVYVSCNPATLARDVCFLRSGGYLPVKTTAVDMFPYTTHVETVVLLTKD